MAIGRTAPSLLEDINLYDFQRPSPVGINILRDAPLQWAREFTISTLLPAGSCLHVFCTKSSQSHLPDLDSRPGQSSLYKVAAVCRKCRTHIKVTVDYTTRNGTAPCPIAAHPLHHLVHSPRREEVARKEENTYNPDGKGETYAFECTSRTCSATVLVGLEPPRLSVDMVHTLTDQAMLKSRTEAAFKVGQGRLEGAKHPSPLEVMSDLRKYLQNAWTPRDSRPIRLDNKRFMLRFGPDGEECKDLLEYMGFTLEVCEKQYRDEVGANAYVTQPQEYWQPPRPNLDDARPFQDKPNIFLDDIEQELGILILQRPGNERELAQDNTTFTESSRDFSRALSCQDCMSPSLFSAGERANFYFQQTTNTQALALPK
jgi:ubiquitin carboxyl-terminal hydrolase 25